MTLAKRATAALIAAASGLAVSHAALAQGSSAESAEQGGLQDIVVTARRTTENIQRTPVAITAFSSKDLKAQAVEGINDLQRATPSLQSNTNVSNTSGMQIGMRGQIMTNTSANTPASVGIYLDDVYLGGASLAGSLVNVEDLDRVEILKGAQGTLYGRNVTAGLVKFVTKKPEDTFDASITGGVGNYERRYLSGMVNIPLAPGKAALRINGVYDDHAGYSYDPHNNKDLEDLHRWGFRGALKLDPTENFSVLLQGWIGEGHDGGPDVRTNYMQPGLTTFAMNVIASQHINGLTPAALSPIIFYGAAVNAGTATQAQRDAFFAAYGAALAALPAAQQFVANQANAPRNNAWESGIYPQFSRAKSRGGALTLAYDLGNATLRSISAYDYSYAFRGFNVGGGPYVPVFTDSVGEIKQFTQEFQVTGKALDSRLTYAVGLYYLHTDLVDERNSGPSPAGAFPLFLGQGPGALHLLNSTVSLNKLRIESKAVYGQATYALTDKLNVTGGLRYTDENVRGRALQYVFNTFTCAAPITDPPTTDCEKFASVKSHNLSYTAGLDYTIVPGVMVYAKTSRGFKAGGVDTFPPTNGPYSTFRPEVSTDYEAGFKADLFDRKVRLNATYYHTDYKDIQRTITVVVNAATNTLGTVTRNAANAKIDGVEFEAQVAPIEGLVLSASGAYTDARFIKYDLYRPGVGFPNDLQDISSQPFQTVAKWTYNLGANYSFDLGEHKINAGLFWSHRSSANLYPLDQFPSKNTGVPDITPAEFTTQPAYGVLNGSLSVEVPSAHATITVWGKNILNKRYAQTISGLVNNGLGLSFANYGPPATVGVDLTFKYR